MVYSAEIKWSRHNSPFTPKEYSRTHTIRFNGGLSLETSSAAEYLGDANLPNPEELFASAIGSCFMLTLLYLLSLKGFTVDDMSITATGTLAKNEQGRMAMTKVILKPVISFQDNKRPDEPTLKSFYNKAHEQCFISNSVKSEIIVEE